MSAERTSNNNLHDPVAVDNDDLPPLATRKDHRFQRIAFLLLRLDIGFYFFWAFIDKVFGFGYHTAPAKAWIRGGSPTKGYLSGINVGPMQGIYHAIAGQTWVDWLFMLGLLGIGVALILGIVIRPAVVCGVAQYFLMWLATWPLATMGGGQPTGSTNPLLDDHTLGLFGLIVIMSCISWAGGPLGRWWSNLSFVKKHPWMR